MAENNNSVCAICGKGYYACISCKDTKSLTPWKIHTDTSEHYKIYQILRGYSSSVYTKEEAKDKLKTVDLSDLKDFRDDIKNSINDILKEDVVKTYVSKDAKQNTYSKKKKYDKYEEDKNVEDVLDVTE